ncbi:MAG TPA: S9 family peptidase [Hyphomicrobiaceae bacterium]|jgi:oligopeptidase B|nr:S9 family peptidase [Hyphomicrobiaceae bacterium]
MHGLNRPIVRPAPPIAERRPTFTVRHGVELADEYAWLRAANWQDVMRDPGALDPKIRAYLEAENAFAEAALADTRGLQDELFAEMKARIKEDDASVPAADGAFEYFTSYATGGQYVRLCRRPRGGGPEEILLDGNKEAEGKAYWALGATAHSPDHRLLAYAVDDKGSELYAVRIRDLATGRDLPEVIPDTRGALVWARDSATLFYIRLDDHHRPLFVCRHRVGTAADADALVYAEPDSGFYVGVDETQSGRFILIDAHDHQTSEIFLIDSDRPESAPRVVAARRHGHEYSVDHHGDRLFVLTNSGGAEDFRICDAPLDDLGTSNWREIVAHKPGRLILDIVAFAGHLVRLEREDGLPRIVVRELKAGSEHAIDFDEEAYSLGMSAGYEFDTTMLRFTYSSMTTPAQVYDYDMEKRARVLRKTQQVPSGHNPADYVTRRLSAPAPDGETVPISLIYKKTTPLDGSAPLLLYGYGAYGYAIPASFSTSWLSLVDRGFIMAIAHIRGGKDKGYRWYTEGKHKSKLNTFTDFIAAGEYLADRRYTSRGRIIANGGSAGGMLMGVVANMTPELFLGIIADVPFVDVLNTMLDDTLPLTPPEWPEWGNPIESREDFDIIRSYSPYDNVAARRYPHIFAYGGLTDPRVTYWEPAKWIARLRARNVSDSLILLKTNMEAGHGGASGRFEALKELALDFAFALKVAGKEQPATG